MSFASVTLCRGKFTEGASCCRTWLVSVVPCCCISSRVKTSTGTASRLVDPSSARTAQHVSSEMRFPTEPPREQRRDREGPTSTGYRVAESATSQGGAPGCDLRLDMRARAQKAAGRGAPGGGTTGAVRRLRPQRLAVRPQSAGIAFIGGNRHHLEDVVGHELVREPGPPSGNRVEPAVAPRVDPAVPALEQQRVHTLTQQLVDDRVRRCDVEAGSRLQSPRVHPDV